MTPADFNPLKRFLISMEFGKYSHDEPRLRASTTAPKTLRSDMFKQSLELSAHWPSSFSPAATAFR